MSLTKLPRFLYGGDYNPDQWPQEIWQEDIRLFKLANINIASVAIFSWAKLQPKEEEFNFGWLDEVMDLLYQHKISVCLATSTAAQPAWLSKKYPEILPVTIDGYRRQHGMRMNFCPNSTEFRKATQLIARKLAERYQSHPGLVLWHVSNEYGPSCYCDTCAKSFRIWLQKRYGTIEELNQRWYTNFWGHTFYAWDEIVPSSYLSEEYPRGGLEGTCFQSMSLDYRRFISDSNLACYLGEKKVLNEITPDVPVTTNLMGTFKTLNYFDWAKHMDVIAWDNYPSNIEDPSNVALRHDLMRSLKGTQPFLLMEQTPSQTNWQAYNALKRPGKMRLWSYQAIAHGSDSIMYFQLRRSRGACEKYHGAVISHAGHEHTRVFEEVKQLGEELAGLTDAILDSRPQAKVGIIFDWENWWAVEYSSGPSADLKYIPQIEKYYRAFNQHNIPVDFLPEEGEFSKYKLIIAPVLYMVKPGVAKRLEAFVESGGILVTTFFSGWVNENDLVTLGGYPGELRKLLGIWVEEIDALFPDQSNAVVINQQFAGIEGRFKCGLVCDLLHAETAKVIAVYKHDFYTGRPAITENRFGAGKAYYLATDIEPKFLDRFLIELSKKQGILPILKTPIGVEVTQRSKGKTIYTFILNHNPKPVTVDFGSTKQLDLLSQKRVNGKYKIPGYGVLICKK
ncbi:MAG: beta-galactosidase [bacterium]